MLPRKVPELPGMDECIFERVVQLLPRGIHDRTSNFLEYIVQLLGALLAAFEKFDITSASKLVELQINPGASGSEEEKKDAAAESSSSAAAESEPVKKRAKATATTSASAEPATPIVVESSIA